jgi:hypothetical protein
MPLLHEGIKCNSATRHQGHVLPLLKQCLATVPSVVRFALFLGKNATEVVRAVDQNGVRASGAAVRGANL